MNSIYDHNRQAWDALVRKKERHTRPANNEELADPLGLINVGGWLGNLRGQQVLCLAAGGGRQSALYAQAGAIVTVVDISPAMLALDREIAAEKGLDVRAIETSMDDLSMLSNASFDLVIHPVSTCYVPDVRPVYREVARVLRGGGLYVSQHKQPASLQADASPSQEGYRLLEPYYRQGPLQAVENSQHREPGTLEFLHRWEELIGQMCSAGFVIEDLVEPYHGGQTTPSRGSFSHRSRFVPPYVRIKARRLGTTAEGSRTVSKVWLPD